MIEVLVLAELLRQADSGLLTLADEVFVGPEDLVEPRGTLWKIRGCLRRGVFRRRSPTETLRRA